MPYIDEKDRKELETRGAKTPGELNYNLTRVIQGYVHECGLDYQTINDIIGALECCKIEFYRRIARPYEDRKREINGDVY